MADFAIGLHACGDFARILSEDRALSEQGISLFASKPELANAEEGS